MREDVELIRRCQDGDVRAQRTFCDRYNAQILRWARHYTYELQKRGLEPEDAAHDVVITVFRAGSVPNQSVEGWLYTITKNTACKRRRMFDRLIGFFSEPPDRIDDTSKPLMLADALGAALAELPDDLRDVIHLCDERGHTGPEAAELLGINPNTVRSRLSTARKMLRDSLRKKGFDPEDES